MQTRERAITRPEREAVRRATSAETAAARAAADAARLTRELADMREDRDRWRDQAERLAAGLDRLRASPIPAPMTAAVDPSAEDVADLCYGLPSIAAHLGLKVPQARHLSDNETIPTFKIGKLTCARRSTLNAWLAEREAAAKGGC